MATLAASNQAEMTRRMLAPMWTKSSPLSTIAANVSAVSHGEGRIAMWAPVRTTTACQTMTMATAANT